MYQNAALQYVSVQLYIGFQSLRGAVYNAFSRLDSLPPYQLLSCCMCVTVCPWFLSETIGTIFWMTSVC